MADVKIDITLKPTLEAVAGKFRGVDISDFTSRKIREFAFLIEAKTKPLVPYKTGLLRSTVQVRNLSYLSAEIGPRTNYAIYVHEGTRYMRPRPFMEWGLIEAQNSGFLDKMHTDLDKYIQGKIQ